MSWEKRILWLLAILLLTAFSGRRPASAGTRPHSGREQSSTIQIGRYRFDPLLEGEPAMPEGLRAGGQGGGFRLVQFHGATQDHWLEQLEQAGLRVLQYYPHHTFLVWGAGSQAESVARLESVRWTGSIHPAYKLSQALDRREGVIANVDITFYTPGGARSGEVEAILAAFERLGARLINAYPAQPDQTFWSAIAAVDAAQLSALAQHPAVLWLGYQATEPILDDEMSAQIVAGNHSGGVPSTGYAAHLAELGYDGSGVTWAVIDTGVDYDHPDLADHIAGGYSFPGACSPAGQPGSDCSNGGHGTHVAGIIAGDASAGHQDANGFLYGLGIAPGAGIFAMNSLSASAWPPVGGWQEHSKQAVLGGAIGGNNSWTSGEGTNHGYQATERTHDLMVLDGNFDTNSVAEPFIELFSAGNSGPDGLTLTAPKGAKNLIVVASSQNYRQGDIDTVSSFSSRGPSADGRWVPTVAAPGGEIASTSNDLGGTCSTSIAGTSDLYATCSGTSMAAPHASGAVILLADWWRSFNGGADPSPAMAKALLVNGAVDMGDADIPNIHEGWGRINPSNTIDSAVPALYWDESHVFDNSGQSWSITVSVPDPSQPLKISLAWSDAPGAIGANPALVNNLNLSVANGGSSYLGNVFSGGRSTTGGTADSLNNLENVYIQNPGGAATITIDATNISGDAVLYNGDLTDQSFALVCSNCSMTPGIALTASPQAAEICAGDQAVYDITVDSISGFTDPATLSATGHPAHSTTSFNANPVVPSGTSRLTIGNTAAAAPGNYTIEISGVASGANHATSVELDLYGSVPAKPALTAPANGAGDVTTAPTFSWAAAARASTYHLQVATDSSFGNLVYSADVEAPLAGAPGHALATALDPLTTYYWRVRSGNACGQSSTSAPFTFTTGDVPLILLVDDDDNDPDVRGYYTAALDAVGVGYDIWDTANSNDEPSVAELSSYPAVIWFTGDEFEGYAGPGAEGESALAAYLDDGDHCLFISSQDYLYDRGHTSFMTTYLGLASYTADMAFTSVTGAGTIFSGTSSQTLNYPATFDNFSDVINPNNTAEVAFEGNWGDAAISKDNGNYRTTFWGFPFAALPTATVREAVMETVVTWCVGYGASLSAGSSTINTLPNGSIIHHFSVENLRLADSYALAIDGNNWPTTLLTPSPLSVTTGMAADIEVAVTVPSLEAQPASDSFTLTLTSANDPALILTATGTTNALTESALALSGRTEQAGGRGQVLVYDLTVTNNGNVSDSYLIGLGPHLWATTAPASVGSLSPGESAPVRVEVTVGEGTSDSVIVTFTSTLDPSVQIAVTLRSNAHRLMVPLVIGR